MNRPPDSVIGYADGLPIFDASRLDMKLMRVLAKGQDFPAIMGNAPMLPPFPAMVIYSDCGHGPRASTVLTVETTWGYAVTVIRGVMGEHPPRVLNLAKDGTIDGFDDGGDGVDRTSLIGISATVAYTLKMCHDRPAFKRIVEVPPEVNARRMKHGKRPLSGYSVIEVPSLDTKCDRGRSYFRRDGVAQHWVRGFYRTHRGKRTFVNAYRRGNPAKGIVSQKWKV